MKFDYNSELDILTVEEEDYSDFSSSAEFANFVVDFSEEGEVLGVEIIDASEATPLDEEDLEKISEVECRVKRTDEFLEVSLMIYIDGSKNIVSSNFPVDAGLAA
jgi:uncharacterized protein YuzE